MKLGFLLLCMLIIYDNNTPYCYIKGFSSPSFPENSIFLGKTNKKRNLNMLSPQKNTFLSVYLLYRKMNIVLGY